jgi:hypothetical protein
VGIFTRRYQNRPIKTYILNMLSTIKIIIIIKKKILLSVNYSMTINIIYITS